MWSKKEDLERFCCERYFPTVAYKCAHVNGDGTYSSCWAGRGQPHTSLDYQVGCVTTTPEGSEGIFTQDSLAGAKLQGEGKLGYVIKPTAILEVLCLGKKNPHGRYNQVYVLGKIA